MQRCRFLGAAMVAGALLMTSSAGAARACGQEGGPGGHGPHGGHGAPGGHGASHLHEHFFPPELVVRHGKEAGVDAKTIEWVRTTARETQAQMIDAEAKVKKLHLEFEGAIATDAPLEDVLKIVDRVGAAETEMKRLHVSLLVKIRAKLTPEQREKLNEVKRRLAPPMPPVPPQPPHAPQPPQPHPPH